MSSSRAGNLWVVVRRANAPYRLVAAGIRGIHRHQRWGGFADLADVKERLRPSQLFSSMASRTRIGLPALAALFWLELQLDKSQLDWGPVGSVGFELATGRQMVTAASDLDIALFAPTQFSRDTARDLGSVMRAAPAKVDVRVETPYCGFSLEEYAREETEKVLIRLPESRKLATNPWAISVIGDNE
jgi:phosphoribosyl-dephospho-CoA transferase